MQRGTTTIESPIDDAPNEEDLDSFLNEVEERLRRSDPKEHETYRHLAKEKKLEYVKANWVKLATAVDRDCLNTMNRLIHPLLAKMLTPQGIDEINRSFTPILERKTVLTGEYHALMTRLAARNPDLTPKEKVHLILPSYLMLFEGIYAAEMDFLVYLLLQNGREYYRVTRRGKEPRILSACDKIKSEPTVHKLRFLQEEGFSAAVSAADRHLRNAIAHLDYTLTSDGILGFSLGKDGAPVILGYEALDKELSRLNSMTLCVNRSVRAFFEQLLGP